MRGRRFAAVAAVAVLGLALAGCGDDDDDEPTAAAAEDEAPAADAGGDVAVAETSLGEVLVDGEGRTLYLFTPDTESASACTGGCAETWPPLVVEGEPAAGEGADEALLGTIERDGGDTQVTYGGHPLYTYAADGEPGDVTGQGVGGNWWAVGPDGQAIEEAAAEGSSGY